ncbi:MAG: hypothetical protein ACRDPY_15250 [Streptosporangiaceae bacterium]
MSTDREQGGFLVPPELASQLLSEHLQASALLRAWDDLAPPGERKPIPRRTRLRWWLAAQREHAAELAYRLISGHQLPDSDY